MSQKPTTSDQRPTTVASVLQIPQSRNVPHRQRKTGKIIAFTGRTLSTDEKAGPKYLNSPETVDLLKIKSPLQPRPRQGSHSQTRLRHPRRRPNGLHLRVLRGIPKRHRQFRHRLHRVAGKITLGRFSKNIVVNFDPDTAGAKATERTLGLLVEEEFNIKVLPLDEKASTPTSTFATMAKRLTGTV